MAFVTVNGFDVEAASQKLVYENLFPSILHIDGKGVVDKYTPTDAVKSVHSIDVMRVLAMPPRFRQIGSANNGAWHNEKNEGGYGNAPQSVHFSIPVDLFYDEGVQLSTPQEWANPVALQQIIVKGVAEAAALSINVVTFAKQLEAHFRLGDNYAIGFQGALSTLSASDITTAEIDKAVYAYDAQVSADDVHSVTTKFLEANASLTEGVPEIGAYSVPVEERQAFITPKFNVRMKNQYMQNASDTATRINANGFINPFTQSEMKRVDSRSMICGMYDGVDMFLLTGVIKNWLYVALGIDGASQATVRGYLDQIGCILVYGAGTCRGVAGPYVEANKNPFFGGVYVLPQMKLGVLCLHGATIKLVIDGGTGNSYATWTPAQVLAIMQAIAFTPIDGSTVTGSVSGYNDGTSN